MEPYEIAGIAGVAFIAWLVGSKVLDDEMRLCLKRQSSR
ncbi:hypothetical protein NVIE_018430 [Nitrososphaera viennensis EN76]|uniref:Uncharacterized protein n=1 Tax=Nitrososphaera viennensis EN76 TaxID=926571 RepID=A0A060HLJ8_9ARCH|nr:hypothetical protein NVIE_018430 [Nitrososphaera viennensis EN76]